MPKRSRDDNVSHANKRPNLGPAIETNEQALALLLDHAGDLIQHLQNLQKASSSGVSAVAVSQGQLLLDLRKTSSVILPALRLLAKEDVGTHRVKGDAGDGSPREVRLSEDNNATQYRLFLTHLTEFLEHRPVTDATLWRSGLAIHAASNFAGVVGIGTGTRAFSSSAHTLSSRRYSFLITSLTPNIRPDARDGRIHPCGNG